jgi:FMN phosphatase YigB (HAD superfamily)
MEDNRLSGRPLRAPKALLLDFGGVVVETKSIEGWRFRLATHVHGLLAKAGVASPDLTVDQIVDDIKAANVADSHWKNAMSRTYSPPELTYEQFWGDFVACDWPKPARDLILREAKELCRLMGHYKSERQMRDGLIDLLDVADKAKVPVAIVSNALAGQVHRDFMAEHGITKRFVLDIHSDDAKVRKPNPEMILKALRPLGIAPADSWYTGDNFDRDVLCGLRAGVGGIILMEAKGTYKLPYQLKCKPDAIVSSPRQLLGLFNEAQSRSRASA